MPRPYFGAPMAGYSYEYDTDPEYGDEEAELNAPEAFAQPQAPEPLANPVIRGFDTPAEAGANTVPSVRGPQPAAQPMPQAQPIRQEPAPEPVRFQAQPAAAQAPQAQAVYAPPQAQAPQPTLRQQPTENDASAEALSAIFAQSGKKGRAADPAEAARQQAIRDNAATLRYQRAQGVAIQTNPDGNAQPQYDEVGNTLYKPGIVQPFTRLDDGRAYRVHRDDYGNQHYFDLDADGQEGADYHTNPHTGERYVLAPNGDGSTRKEVIGQDAFIPKINALETDKAQHRAAVQQADFAVDQAMYGVRGGQGFDGVSLSELRDQHQAISQSLRPLQAQLVKLENYRQGGGAFNAQMLDTYRSASAAIEQMQPRAQTIQEQIDAREGTINEARQQRTESHAALASTAQRQSVLAAARHGRGNIREDLAQVLQGGAIQEDRARLLSNAGLLVEDAQADGTTILRVPREAVALLPKGLQAQVRANPTAFNAMADANPQAGKLVRAVAKAAPEPSVNIGKVAEEPPGDAAPQISVRAQNAQKGVAVLEGKLARGETLNASQLNALAKMREAVAAETNAQARGQMGDDFRPSTANVTGAEPALDDQSPGSVINRLNAKVAAGGQLSEQEKQAYRRAADGADAEDAAFMQQAQKPADTSFSHQAANFGGNIVQGMANFAGTTVRGPLGQGVIGLSNLTNPFTVAHALAGGGLPDPQAQAKAVGDAIGHSADGLVDPALANTVPAKAGHFIGGGGPLVSPGGAGAPALIPTLFANGYQTQYEEAKAKLEETAAKTGQPLNAEQAEATAHRAGVLGGAIDGALAVALGGAGNAVRTVFGGVERATISQAMMNAFERDGARGVGNLFKELQQTGQLGKSAEAVNAIQAELNKGFGARAAAVAKTAARDAGIGAAAQAGHNIVARENYDPERTLDEGVAEQAIGFGAMGAISQGVRQGVLAKRAKQSSDLLKPPDAGGGLLTNGGRPNSPAPSPADLAKPVEGKVVESRPAPKTEDADPTVTRAGGQSTISLGGTTLTVPTAQESMALNVMRRGASRQAAPIDVDASEVAPTSAPTSPAPQTLTVNGTQLEVVHGTKAGESRVGDLKVGDDWDAGYSVPAIYQPDSSLPAGKEVVGEVLPDGRVVVRRGEGEPGKSGTIVPVSADQSGTMVPVSEPANALKSSTTVEVSPVVAELQRQRDNQQAMLDHGKLTPEEADQARAWVEHFDGRIAALRGGAAPAAGQPSAGKPGAEPSGVATAPAPAGDSLSGGSSERQGRSSLPNEAQPVPDEGFASPAAPEVTLPRDLAGAKPRYAYGPKQFELSFASDLDKTAYTLAQGTPNKRHADYLKAAREQTGLSEQELVQHGQAVRAAIKELARDGDPAAGPLRLPKQAVASRPSTNKESVMAAPTTFENAAGQKIDSRRTAFHPESGTLGVPREQMPQISSKHRGALANFLKGRGIDWENADVLPGSLKPSQADFHPGKVEKAETLRRRLEAANRVHASRRILVSADNHVIDGHHQWLERLKNKPGEPMPVVRLKAPARDILSRIHEFPSAGMEKVADIEDKAPSTFAEAAPIIQQAAKERVAALRNAGHPIPGKLNALANWKVSTLSAKGQMNYLAQAAEVDAAHGLGLTQQGVRFAAPGNEQPSTEFTPTTPQGKAALRSYNSMMGLQASGKPLSDTQRQTLANATAALKKDAAAQSRTPATPEPAAPDTRAYNPTTGPGKQALKRLNYLLEKQSSGKTLSEEETKDIARTREILDDDAAPSASGAPAASTPRQPITPAGKEAQRTLSRLDALRQKGVELDWRHRQAQREAELDLARDLNAQVLGPHPKPTTEAGKQARANIEAWEPSRSEFNAGQLLSLHGEYARLEQDFTQQRLALEARSQGRSATPAASAPVAPEFAPVTGPGKQALKRLNYLLQKQAQGAPLSESEVKDVAHTRALLEREAAEQRAAASAPMTPQQARTVAQKQITANAPLLRSLGVKGIVFESAPEAKSGVEFRENGTLRIDPEQLAAAMTTVRGNQAELGIRSTPEEWFSQVLYHEGIHAADAAVAREKGQSLQQRYDALLDEAMPQGWQEAGREAYGAKGWDALPEWKRKAEFVRQVIEGKYTGRITEALYKFIREAIDYLKKVAGFEGVDPRFKAHVREVEARVEAAKGGTGEAKAPAAKPKPRSFQIPHSPLGAPDVIDRIVEQGGILSKGKMSKQPGFSAADYEGLTALPGVYKRLLGGKLSPDRMAAQLGLDGPQALAEAIHQAVAARKSVRAETGRQATLEKQAGRFEKDALTAPTKEGEAKALSVSNLSVGDKVEINGETLTVRGVDPDTLEVTLEDHKKYGIQKVEDGQAIYVESAQLQEHGADDFGPTEEPQTQAGGEEFSLESVSPEQLRAEEKSRAQKNAIADGQSKPLSGTAGDLTADIFGEGETPLFNERRDNGSLGAAEPERREQTPDPSRVGTIKELVQDALKPGPMARKRYVQYATVSPVQAAHLKADTELDLEGYRRNLDNYTVRHTWRRHGDAPAETARGNLPITEADFERLPQIIDRPDASLRAGENEHGQPIILSARRFNGYYIVAEEARTGPRVLSLVSLYKVSARPPGNDVGEPTPLSTPEAIRSTARQILQRLVAQSNFLHGGNPGASTLAAAEPAAEDPSLRASALPLRKALVEKIQALRKDGQAVPEELPRWLAKLSEVSPLWEGMTPAAEAVAWKELRALGARHGLDLPATLEESEGEALFAAQPSSEEGRRREAGKLEKVRRTIEREAPEALTFWHKLLEQINVAPTSGIYQEVLDAQTPARPIKGQEAAKEARTAENFYTGQAQADFTALQKFYAKNIWRLKLLSEEDFNAIAESGEGLGTTIDLPGATGHAYDFDPTQKALVTQPVINLLDKLQEAKLTGPHLPETKTLSEMGVEKIDAGLPAVFDAYFGVNRWVLKSYDNDLAYAGNGNWFAPKLKNLFAAHAENRATAQDFAMLDAIRGGADKLMVQRLYDVDDHTDRST